VYTRQRHNCGETRIARLLPGPPCVASTRLLPNVAKNLPIPPSGTSPRLAFNVPSPFALSAVFASETDSPAPRAHRLVSAGKLSPHPSISPKCEPANPTPKNPVNPVQNFDPTARRHPAPKPNRSGSPLQTNALDRTENESQADQKRTEPGSKVEKSSQSIRANQPNQLHPSSLCAPSTSSTARLPFPFAIGKWKSFGHFNILAIRTRKTSAISNSLYELRFPRFGGQVLSYCFVWFHTNILLQIVWVI